MIIKALFSSKEKVPRLILNTNPPRGKIFDWIQQGWTEKSYTLFAAMKGDIIGVGRSMGEAITNCLNALQA